jgi:outer membrane immunogenic protein
MLANVARTDEANMRLIQSILACAFVLTAHQAIADEKSAPTANWGGLYVGVHAGALRGKADWLLTRGAVYADWPTRGMFGGVHAGYNFQSGSAVIGLQAEGNISGESGRARDPSGLRVGTRSERVSSADARLGYAFGRALVYAIGGVAFSDNRTHGYLPGLDAMFRGNHVGFDYGVGAEFAITDRVSMRLEYRHYDLGGKNFGPTPRGAPWYYTEHAHRYEKDVVRMGFSYRFGSL